MAATLNGSTETKQDNDINTLTTKMDEISLSYATGKDGLSIQNLSAMDLSTLSPLTGEVMSRQATINIGTIGHVAHGKSTIVKALSGVKTTKHKMEMERNITIKLGYANAKIYKGVDPRTDRPDCYISKESNARILSQKMGSLIRFKGTSRLSTARATTFR